MYAGRTRRALLGCWFGLVMGVGCSSKPPEEKRLVSSAAPMVVQEWQGAGSLPETRKYHAGVMLPSGRVLVVGGAKGDVSQSSASVYTPETGLWTGVASLPEGRQQHAAVLLNTGKVLVAGGQKMGSGPLAAAVVYDAASTPGTWTPAGSFASGVARHSLTATVLPSGKVLVAGGGNTGGSQSTVDVYDPGTGTWSWSQGQNLGTARRDHTATLLKTGKVLVAGGRWSTSLAAAEEYDPQSNTWTKTQGALETPRHNHTATLLPSGKVLVVGGRNNPGGGVVGPLVGTAEEYDPVERTWSTVPAPGVPGVVLARELHTAMLLATGKVLVAGGLDGSGNSLKSAVVYDPAQQKWSVAPAMATARHGHVAVPLESLGKVLVVAGLSAANGAVSGVAAAEAYVYDVCEGVVCNNPPNRCYEDGTCSNRLCSYAPKQAGASCDDDDEGTVNDVCDGAGVCAGVVACTTPPDDCHGAPGTYVNGVCTYPPKAAETPCDDANACTTGDVCNGTGVCGGTAVVCNSPPGSCHEAAGLCSNGTCSYTPRPSGAECPGDGNACTQDRCDGTGTCSHTLVAAGTSCGSGQVCNAAGQCQSGCWIAGVYHAAGATNPSAACQQCTPSLSVSQWSSKPVGATCSSTTYDELGGCASDYACDQWGHQSFTVTTYACTSSGECVGSSSDHTQDCWVDTDGQNCGYEESCSSCGGFNGACGETGTQSCYSRDYACSNGSCQESYSNSWTEDCSRSTDGIVCGTFSYCSGLDCYPVNYCSEGGWKPCGTFELECGGGSCQMLGTYLGSYEEPCPYTPPGPPECPAP